MSLYDVLGVSAGATASEIRRAYKRLAQKHHPDRECGDADTFERVAHAYAVLGSPTRRERYDLEGEEDAPPSLDRRVHALLAGMFSRLVDAPEKVNIVQEIKVQLEAHRAEAESAADKAEQRIETVCSQLHRVSSGGDTSLFDSIIDSKRRELEGELARAKDSLMVLETALEQIALYEDTRFDATPEDNQARFQAAFNEALYRRSEFHPFKGTGI